MIEVPDGSIYIWMYKQGLKHTPLDELEHAIWNAGKDIRPKDYANYRNGWDRSDRCEDNYSSTRLHPAPPTPSMAFISKPWDEYPVHPYKNLPEIDRRWVPVGASGKPMIQWSRCCMYKWDALNVIGQQTLAENMWNTQMIVIDCDGDHGNGLDMETIDFLWQYSNQTHMLSKRKMICEYDGYESSMDFRPASFHLTFRVGKIIPTMHFPWCGIDIIGNKTNSLRYRKDKVWNGLEPLTMTPTIWADLQNYVRRRQR